MTIAGQRLIAGLEEAVAHARTAPDGTEHDPFPKCDHPLVIRKAGSPIVDLIHRGEQPKPCHITLSGYPESHVRAAWRRHSQE
jgi:hypothetical protein